MKKKTSVEIKTRKQEISNERKKAAEVLKATKRNKKASEENKLQRKIEADIKQAKRETKKMSRNLLLILL